jgi:hypothetical protein
MYYNCAIVEQRCDIRGVYFKASNGWMIRTFEHPEICSGPRIFFIRGLNDLKNDTKLATITESTLMMIAQAVAEFNGRKNVVKIGASGFII